MTSRGTTERHAATVVADWLGHVVGVAELSDVDDDKDEQR